MKFPEIEEEKEVRVFSTNNKPKPSLDAQNPATQLADQLAKEATDEAKKLKATLDQTAKDSDLKSDLKPLKKTKQLTWLRRPRKRLTTPHKLQF